MLHDMVGCKFNSNHMKKRVAKMLATATTCILRHWGKADIPTNREWLLDVATVTECERVIYIINGQIHIFDQIWDNQEIPSSVMG